MRQIQLVFVLIVIPLTVGNISTAVAQTEQLAVEPMVLGVEEPEKRELETDRDAFTPATSTAGPRVTIIESSYSFIDNRSVPETHSFPELLVRHGITERLELRLGWNYEVGGEGDVVSGEDGAESFESRKIERDSQILYGAKASLSDQEGWIPRSVVIVQGYTPTSGAATATDVVGAYAFGWELANRWRLDSSLRYGTEHTVRDAFNEWLPSVVLRVPLSDRWNVHMEYFGIYSQGAEREFSRGFVSPGTHFLLTENIELGVRGGWGITDDSPNFFTNFGIGWRF
ncbi:transporter [bacterium]|nr:transporter [bacterium]